jgi:hypothetical protein
VLLELQRRCVLGDCADDLAGTPLGMSAETSSFTSTPIGVRARQRHSGVRRRRPKDRTSALLVRLYGPLGRGRGDSRLWIRGLRSLRSWLLGLAPAVGVTIGVLCPNGL